MRTTGDKILIVCLVVLILVIGGVLIFMLPEKQPETLVAGSTVYTSVPLQPVATDVATDSGFSDGLGVPDKIIPGTLDEFGAGVASVEQFYRDINNDGVKDQITRTHIATGNAHDYAEYKIELNTDGKMVDITPHGFRTTHGADCALRLIRFHYVPTFGATIISRPFVETWDTPSMASRTTYSLDGEKITDGQPENLSAVCDVAQLF